MKRIALLLVMLLAIEAQTTINGGRVIKGTLDASGATSTLPYRTGSGSPAGRDNCGKPGETYFQTDAAAGQNVWACTAPGTPGTWNPSSAGATVATGTTAPSGSCSAGALYVRTDVRQFYICSAANAWQLGSYGSDVLANRPASCAAGQIFLATDMGTLSFCATPGNPGSWQAIGGAIASVFGRTGAVTAQAGDYTAAQVTNSAQTNAGNTFTAGTQDFSQAAHTLPAKVGTTATKPATCVVGEMYFASDATAGQNWYYCTAANTWTQQSSPAAAVPSVFGRTGAVTAQTGDYSAAQVSNAVANNSANTYSGGGLQDFSADNIKIPAAAGFTATASKNLGYDTTNTNVHAWNGADAIVAPFASAPTTGHCVQATVSSGKVTLSDAGGACTTGGGGGTVSSGTQNQLAYYGSNGTVVGGLATANSGVLVTSGAGAPSIGTALPNGVTATTQSQGDNSTKLATTGYVDSGLGGKAASNASATVNGVVCTLGSTCTVADATKVPTSTTVNGHALSSNVTVTASDVGLGSVTNNVQTQAAIVPNTAPSSGQILVGNAGGTAYAPVTTTGCTITSAGAVTCTPTAVGLSNVTNNAQTQASIVPNTVPSAGQIHAGNAGGTAFGVVSMSGDATLGSTGALTLTTVNGAPGSCGDATHVCQVTTNGKGLVTNQSAVAITGGSGSVTLTNISPSFGGTTNITLGTATVFNLGTLTGNTTIAVSGPTGGVGDYFVGCMDATGGRTVTWPASFKNVPSFDPTPSACSMIGPIVSDGSGNYYKQGTTTAGLIAMGATATVCSGAVPAGQLCVSMDATRGTVAAKDSSGNIYVMAKTAGSTGQLASSDLSDAAQLARSVGTVTVPIPTSAVAANSCDVSATTATVTGANAATDVWSATPTGDPTGATGYGGGTNGGITFWIWISTNAVNVKRCNQTGSSITPGALSLLVKVLR